MQPLWKRGWRFLQKLKVELACDPAISLLGIYPKNENTTLKRYMHTNVHSSTIYNWQDMETTQVSIGGCMDKEDVVHVYNRTLLSNKKNGVLPFQTTWMDLEGIML